MIEKIKEQLQQNMNNQLLFKYNYGRNQVEAFEGMINKLYPSIFTVNVDNSDVMKSFSYKDVLTGSLIIIISEKKF